MDLGNLLFQKVAHSFILHFLQSNSSQLQLFENSLLPINSQPHRFELTKIEENYIFFKGVTSGAHKTLSYERPEKNVFYIRFNPHDGDEVEIRLTPQ